MHRAGGHSVLSVIEKYSAFLAGKGSGSGWDRANKSLSIGSFLPLRPITIFDVGANDGRSAAHIQRLRPTIEDRYFLFEPAEYCFSALAMRAKELPNAVMLRVAVSEMDGTETLYVPPVKTGLASLHERRDVSVVQHRYTRVEVKTRSLDSVANEYNVETIELLKMDIEGHELVALKGAKELLGRRAIKVLTFEFGSANVNSRTFFRDFWELLTGYGFTLFRIVPGGGTHEIKRYSEELEYFRGATNYIGRLRQL